MNGNFLRLYAAYIIITGCMAIVGYFMYQLGVKFTIMSICTNAFIYLIYLMTNEVIKFIKR